MSYKRKRRLLVHLFFSYTGLILLTLIILAFSFHLTIGKRVHRITRDLYSKQIQRVADEVSSMLQAHSSPVELGRMLQKLGPENQGWFNFYDPQGLLRAASDSHLARSVRIDKRKLEWISQRPLTNMYQAMVVPVRDRNEVLQGYLFYRPRVLHYRVLDIHFIILLLVLGIGVVFLIYRISHRLTRPLYHLADSVDRISRGELDHPVADSSIYEFSMLAREFSIMTRRISELLAGQREFLASISHELRSPLTRMKLLVRLLDEKTEDQTVKSRMRAISEEIEIMDRLIGELIELSRLDLGQEILHLEPTDAVEFVQQAIDTYSRNTQAQTSGTNCLITFTPERHGPLVALDRERIKRVCLNLIENGCRYSSEPARLDISVDCTIRQLSIKVRDYGPGLGPDEREKIFLPFYRSSDEHKATEGKTENHGLGIGLFIARKIVEKHGGSLNAIAPETGSGLVMEICLPIREGNWERNWDSQKSSF
ncbi:HAMP domain-containing histidine kinase [bacterium]|nr:HAMP domain-containing histidine kinase [bacterium]